MQHLIGQGHIDTQVLGVEVMHRVRLYEQCLQYNRNRKARFECEKE